tara:strand:+ start:13732 stop:14613 length:882 start_codon:yes stop_codon:yes gene_type:complete
MVRHLPIFFAHIPKTAGTTIKEYFGLPIEGHMTMQDFLLASKCGDIDSGVNADAAEDQIIDFVAKINKLSELVNMPCFEIAFKFSFVRNPWDRAVSIYEFHKDDFDFGTFEDFTNSLLYKEGIFSEETGGTTLRPTQTQYLSIADDYINSYSPEEEKIKNPTRVPKGRHPARNSGHLCYDYIGRFENIEREVFILKEFLTQLSNKIESCGHNINDDEFPWETKDRLGLFRKNENRKPDYRTYYENFNQIYAVFDYYYNDVVNFNYGFTPGTSYDKCNTTIRCFKQYKEKNDIL